MALDDFGVVHGGHPTGRCPLKSTAVLLAVLCALLIASCQTDDFQGPNGLISDHDGYWAGQVQDDQWACESGAWYRISNSAWTNSDLFRCWTYREDNQYEEITFDLMVRSFLPGTQSRPARPWDGVKVWMHARHEDGGVLGAPMSGSPAGYTAEVALRDGRIYVQKKVPGTAAQWPGADSCIQNGCYWLLGSTQTNPAHLNQWERVGGRVVDNGSSVTVSVIRNGQVVLSVVDNGSEGGPPLRAPGRIGVRGDNTDFYVDNFLAQ